MTEEKIKVLSHLRQIGRTVAPEIAHRSGLPLTKVYEALVSLENDDLARVELTHSKAVCVLREWVAA